MKLPPRHFALAALTLIAVNFSAAQVSLSGTTYIENFDSIGSGLPNGWSVYTSASITSLGITSAFTIEKTNWSTTTSGTGFRNIASNNGSPGDGTTAQSTNENRALGWRPLNAGTRDGAVTVAFTDTIGFENFSLSVLLFTANDVTGVETYDLEYRIGATGSFTSLGTYSTATPFSSTTLTANSVTLSALNNQSDSVFIRIRGTNANAVGAGNLDTIGIDNFSLTYTAVPEPSTYAAILGGVALVGVMAMRRRKPAANAA